MNDKNNGKPRLDFYFHSRLNTWLIKNKNDFDFDVRMIDEDKICSVTLYNKKAHITRRYIVQSFMNTSDLRALVDLAIQHIYWELSDLQKESYGN